MNSKRQLPLEKFLANATGPLKDKLFLCQPLGQGKYHRFTWAEALSEASKVAQALSRLNLPAKSKIALLSKNCAHWIITDLAIWMAGHISVPLYPTLQASTIREILAHSEAAFIFVGKLDLWDKQCEGVPQSMPKVGFPFWENSGVRGWNDFISGCTGLDKYPFFVSSDVATIIYTSGTTGMAKGVVHTFGSISFPVLEALEEVEIYPSDRFLSYLPLSHIAERLLVELGAIYSGGTIYFAESIESFKQDLKYASPTIFLAVPSIWSKFQQGILSKIPDQKLKRLLKTPIIGWVIRKKIQKELGLSKVRLPITGAAPISQELLEWFDLLGITILEVYGMTENFGFATFNFPGRVRLGTLGESWKNGEVKISETGEILTRSPALMKEYYKDPEKTKETIDSEGWLHTGDKGQLDERGYLKITGRVKDIFKTSKGKYVSPGPIEKMFATCFLVDQVCVLGQGLPAPMAIVTLSEQGQRADSKIIQAELQSLYVDINNKVENFERLGKILISNINWGVDNGLMTPTLKIKRTEIENYFKENILELHELKGEIHFIKN